ncbi:phytanoyl-CoA dioxygenase family protein [Chryseolinea lacunae]|uniref:Phytanoyl-CoA dioxygenase family protein n=1 Tax=Chryseolinea lacunae TaxID=2801331 RepID=A0ABS1KLI6_9BACT|nr:phytanoyl-CoA dioxygenase family protein [Chryseolinea lacunae]MBL0740311.1 phytanoyl-CoA dioxygenase family protein [Chryseolinea lacunae]
MEYKVNGVALSYEPVGSRAWGEANVLLDAAVDLTAATSWAETGFGVQQLFSPDLFAEFSKRTRALLLRLWQEAGLTVDENFLLENYHRLVPDFTTHLRAVDKTKLLNVADFPIAIADVEARISELCRVSLVACNPYDNQSVFHFRVIRPQQADNNPLHRDVWLEDYDDCINLYIPVAGSNANSSLILVPGSHRWPESRIEKTEAGAHINGVKFNVPAVTDIRGDYTVERPDPKENEVLIFSPYLIHGGAANLNKDQTRISIEMRLWKR